MTKRIIKPPPFNRELFGQIVTPPPAMFPYVPGPDGLPFPEMPDPLGAGQAAIDFLRNFKIPEGRAEGKNLADNLPGYMERAVRVVMGHRDPATWTRYIKQACFSAPRKNGKSYLSSIFSLLFLFSEHEKNGEILCAATSAEQAKLIFNLCLRTLRTNPELAALVRVQENQSTLISNVTGTRMVSVPAEPDRLHGRSPSVICADELWAWKGSRGHSMWSSLTTGMGARANPLVLIATTSPERPPAHDDIYSEQIRYFRSVETGERDDRRALPMLWICGDGEDTSDEAVWKKYNPGLGSTLSMEEMRDAHAVALASSSGMHAWNTLRMNRVPQSSLDGSWLRPEAIERCVQPVATLAEIRDMPIRAVGLDSSVGWDFTSVCVLGVDDEGRAHARQMSWCCRSAFEDYANKVPLDRFRERGELMVDGVDQVTSETIASEIIGLCEMLGVGEIAVDPAYMQNIAPYLEASGIEIVHARQNVMAMSSPMLWMEELVSGSNLAIGDDEMFKWMLQNTGVLSSSYGRKPIKIGDEANTNPRKMDAVTAMLTAAQLAQEQRFDAGSAYVKKRNNFELIDPYGDILNALAILEPNGSAFYGFDSPIDPTLGTKVLTP